MSRILEINKEIEELKARIFQQSTDFERRIDDLTKIQERLVTAVEKNHKVNILLDTKLKTLRGKNQSHHHEAKGKKTIMKAVASGYIDWKNSKECTNKPKEAKGK